MKDYKQIESCLCCGKPDLTVYFSLGRQPLANNYHTGQNQPELPLEVAFCPHCFHSQLTISVNPHLMFDHYVYLSGTSQTLRAYFETFADGILAAWKSSLRPRVLEVACNDGTLLEMFQREGCEVQGIEPAKNLMAITSQKDIPVACEYWNLKTAEQFRNRYDVVVAVNVLPHVPDPYEFLLACKEALVPSGKIYIQTSHADIFSRFEFDTIYHEHVSYFTAKSFETLAERAGLSVWNAKKVPIHSSSFVFTLGAEEQTGNMPAIKEMVSEESRQGLHQLETYYRFGRHAKQMTDDLANAIRRLQSEGNKVIGYGAAAKGNTLLNFAGIDLEYIVDDNPMKCGLLTPGRNIPIENPRRLFREAGPVAILVLAWNFFEEIQKRVIEQRRTINDWWIEYFPAVKVSKTR